MLLVLVCPYIHERDSISVRHKSFSFVCVCVIVGDLFVLQRSAFYLCHACHDNHLLQRWSSVGIDPSYVSVLLLAILLVLNVCAKSFHRGHMTI